MVFQGERDEIAEIVREVVATGVDAVLLAEPGHDLVTPVVVLEPDEAVVQFGKTILSRPLVYEVPAELDLEFGVFGQFVVCFEHLLPGEVAVPP